MNKIISLALLFTFLNANLAWSVGKIQNEDVKSVTDLTNAGSTAAHLINTDKIYDVANAQQLSASISNGQLGGGGVGKNYLSAFKASLGSGTLNIGNGDFELGTTTGFSLAHTALSGTTPTSVASAGVEFDSTHGGSAASGNLSLSVVSSGTLQKSHSGSLVSSAASTAGDLLISKAFFIDLSDQAKMMTVSFDYKAVSGTFDMSGTSTNTFAVWIYDVTNAAWIQPAGVYNLTQASGVGKTNQVTFQTTSNSTKYQLALVNVNATSGAYTLYVDELSVGPQSSLSGPALTDCQSFTPTGSWSTNTTYTGTRCRVGDRMFINVQGTLSGAPDAVALTINMPSGYSIDTTKTQSTATLTQPFGHGILSNTGVRTYGATVAYNSTTSVALLDLDDTIASNTVNATSPFTWANTHTFNVNFSVPIVGWSGNTAASSDTDTRVVEAKFPFAATNVSNSADTQLNLGTATKDTHGAISGSTYVIPVTGIYEAGMHVSFASATTNSGIPRNLVRLYVNGSADDLSYCELPPSAVGNTACSGKFQRSFNAGDVVTFRAQQATTTASLATVVNAPESYGWINRLSGPSVINPTEIVYAKYTGSSSSITGGAATVMVNTTKEKDTHGFYNSGSGVATIPISGTYLVICGAEGIAFGGSNYLGIIPRKNGTGFARMELSTGSARRIGMGSGTVSAVAGDTIDCQLDNQTGSTSALNGSADNFISITRLGN